MASDGEDCVAALTQPTPLACPHLQSSLTSSADQSGSAGRGGGGSVGDEMLMVDQKHVKINNNSIQPAAVSVELPISHNKRKAMPMSQTESRNSLGFAEDGGSPRQNMTSLDCTSPSLDGMLPGGTRLSFLRESDSNSNIFPDSYVELESILRGCPSSWPMLMKLLPIYRIFRERNFLSSSTACITFSLALVWLAFLLLFAIAGFIFLPKWLASLVISNMIVIFMAMLHSWLARSYNVLRMALQLSLSLLPLGLHLVVGTSPMVAVMALAPLVSLPVVSIASILQWVYVAVASIAVMCVHPWLVSVVPSPPSSTALHVFSVLSIACLVISILCYHLIWSVVLICENPATQNRARAFARHDGVIVASTPQFDAFFGEPGSMAGRSYLTYLSGDASNIHKLALENESAQSSTIHQLAVNGKHQVVLCRAFRWTHSMVMLDFENITEASMRSNANESLLEGILNTMANGVIMADQDMIISHINPAASKMFGYEPHELLGKNVCTLMPDNTSRAHHHWVRRYLETGEARVIGTCGRHIIGRSKDGKQIALSFSISEYRSPGGKRMFAAVFNNIQHELDSQASARLRKEMDSKLEIQRQFIQYLFHVLRNPLNLFSKGIDQLLMDIDESRVSVHDPALLEEFLSRLESDAMFVNDSAAHANHVMDNLLDIYNLSCGKIVLDRVPFNLVQLLSMTCDCVRPLVPEGVQLHCNLQPSTAFDGMDLLGSPYHLQQVLINLLSNACAATTMGEIQLNAFLIEKTENNAKIQIQIADTGPGLPQEKQIIAFRNVSMFHFNIGTGLGLTISYNLVKLMGGNLLVSSPWQDGLQGCEASTPLSASTVSARRRSGRLGTMLYFTLSFSLAPPNEDGDALSSPPRSLSPSSSGRPLPSPKSVHSLNTFPAAGNSGGGAKADSKGQAEPLALPSDLQVLIADTSVLNRRIWQTMLTKQEPFAEQKWSVEVVETGEAALKRIQQGTKLYDIILLADDLGAEKKSGRQVTQTIRQWEGANDVSPSIIVGICQKCVPEDKDEAIRCGQDLVYGRACPPHLQVASDFSQLLRSRLNACHEQLYAIPSRKPRSGDWSNSSTAALGATSLGTRRASVRSDVSSSTGTAVSSVVTASTSNLPPASCQLTPNPSRHHSHSHLPPLGVSMSHSGGSFMAHALIARTARGIHPIGRNNSFGSVATNPLAARPPSSAASSSRATTGSHDRGTPGLGGVSLSVNASGSGTSGGAHPSANAPPIASISSAVSSYS